MKAIGYRKAGPITADDALVELDVPVPTLGGKDLLVEVRAISVNPVDTKVRANVSPEAGAKIIGYDAAGVVKQVGAEVSLFKAGDEVFYAGDITRPGTNSELHAVDERIVGRKPATLDFAAAAALPLTSITAYEALFDRLQIDRDGGNTGETLLIIGGAGGVGSIGIQLAKRAGLKVIATASREESISWVKKLGADHVINHREALKPQIESLGLDFVDHIAIFNDTDGHWEAATDLIRPQGAIVSIVENERPLDQSRMKTKAATFVWEFMFTRAMFQTPDMIEQHHLLDYVAGQVDEGNLRTTAGDALTPINAQNLREAHASLEQGSTIGKVVLAGWA